MSEIDSCINDAIETLEAMQESIHVSQYERLKLLLRDGDHAPETRASLSVKSLIWDDSDWRRPCADTAVGEVSIQTRGGDTGEWVVCYSPHWWRGESPVFKTSDEAKAWAKSKFSAFTALLLGDLAPVQPSAAMSETARQLGMTDAELPRETAMASFMNEPFPVPEPDAWQWRSFFNGRWGAWIELGQPLEVFEARNSAMLKDGTYQTRPLYAAPTTSPEPLADFARDLASKQEPLGAEFAKALADNAWDLYETEPEPDAVREALRPFADLADAMYVSGHCGGASPEDWPDKWSISTTGGKEHHMPQAQGGVLTVADFRKLARLYHSLPRK